MADVIQHRRDTEANWSAANPVLAEGEIGYVLEKPNLHKMGDGEHPWSELPYRGFTGTLAQTLEPNANSENEAPTVAAVNDSLKGHKLVSCTLDEFEGIETKDDNTLYFCTEGEEIES